MQACRSFVCCKTVSAIDWPLIYIFQSFVVPLSYHIHIPVECIDTTKKRGKHNNGEVQQIPESYSSVEIWIFFLHFPLRRHGVYTLYVAMSCTLVSDQRGRCTVTEAMFILCTTNVPEELENKLSPSIVVNKFLMKNSWPADDVIWLKWRFPCFEFLFTCAVDVWYVYRLEKRKWLWNLGALSIDKTKDTQNKKLMNKYLQFLMMICFLKHLEKWT